MEDKLLIDTKKINFFVDLNSSGCYYEHINKEEDKTMTTSNTITKEKSTMNQLIDTIRANNDLDINVEVKATGSDAIKAMSILSNEQYIINVNNDVIESKDTFMNKALFKLRNCESMTDFNMVRSEVVSCLFNQFVKGGFEAVEHIVKDNAPSIGEDIVYSIREALEFRRELQAEKVRRHISVTNDKFDVIYSDINDALVAKMMEGGVYVLTHGMGEGKTSKCTVPMFNLSCDQGLKPIGISPKRVLASMICNDERNYRNVMQAQIAKTLSNVDIDEATGVFGVINSVASNVAFKDFRDNGSVLIAEEHEGIISQSVGKAVKDGSLKERAKLLASYMELIKTKDVVVLADAMFSESQAEMILKETGKKVTIVKSKKESNKEVTINILNENENIARANRVLKEGKNVLAFCDGSNKGEKSKFNETFHALNSNAKSSLQVTANTISEMKDSAEFISNLPEEMTKYQLSMISPVVNSGVSIETGHADSVHLFSNEVMSVKEAVQTIGRDRVAKEINVSFNKSRASKITSVRGIVLNEMVNSYTHDEVSDALFDSMMSNKDILNVAKVIAEENMMRVNYETNLVIMLQELGFKVKFDSDNAEEGSAQKSAGKKVEAEERTKSLVEAEHISKEQYESISSKEFITNEDKVKIAKHEMRDFYQREVTEELVEFDKKGKTRKVIENNLYARNCRHSVGTAGKAKEIMIKKLFEMIKVDAVKLTGSFSKEDTDAFVAFVNKGEIKIGDYTMKASEAFNIAFEKSIDKGHSTSVVTKLLKSKFGINSEKSGQVSVGRKRVNVYSICEVAMKEELREVVESLSVTLVDVVDVEDKYNESVVF